MEHLSLKRRSFTVVMWGKPSFEHVQRICQRWMTHITHGPLFGMERRIRKIDRHKRIARIEAPLKHISDSLLAGLEIVSKA